MKTDNQAQFMDDTLTSHKVPKAEEPVEPTEPVEPEEPVEEPTEPQEPVEPEEPKDPEAELLDWLSAREEGGTGGEEPEEPQEPAEPAEPQEPAETAEPEELNFSLDNDQFEEVTSSPEALSNYAEKIYKKAVTDLRSEIEATKAELRQELASAKEEVVQNIPQLVSKSAERTQAVKGLVSNFYTKYPDLKEKREYVRDMIRTISGKNPDMKPEQVLTEVATRAKRDFGIAEKAQSREQKRKGGPKFAGAGGRRSPSGAEDTRTQQQKLLDETFG